MSYKLKINSTDIPLLLNAFEAEGFTQEIRGRQGKRAHNAGFVAVDTDLKMYRFIYSERQFDLCLFPTRDYVVEARLNTIAPRKTVVINGETYFEDEVAMRLQGYAIEREEF